jgi:hypothetical protein
MQRDLQRAHEREGLRPVHLLRGNGLLRGACNRGELFDRGLRLSGMDVGVGAEHAIRGLLDLLSIRDCRIVGSARFGVVPEERVDVPLLEHRHRQLGVLVDGLGIGIARLLELIQCTVHVAQLLVALRLRRISGDRLLHVPLCLREVTRLTKEVRKAKCGLGEKHLGVERDRSAIGFARHLVAVERPLRVPENDPRTRSAGVRPHELLRKLDPPLGVVVEEGAIDLDENPLGVALSGEIGRCAIEILLELGRRGCRGSEVQIPVCERRVLFDRQAEMLTRLTRAAYVEQPLAHREVRARRGRGGGDRDFLRPGDRPRFLAHGHGLRACSAGDNRHRQQRVESDTGHRFLPIEVGSIALGRAVREARLMRVPRSGGGR